MTKNYKLGQTFRFDNTKTRYRIVRVPKGRNVFYAMRLTTSAWQPIHIKVTALSDDKPENATFRVTNVDNGKSVEKKGIVFLKTTAADRKAFTEIKRKYVSMKPLKSWTHGDYKKSAAVRKAVGGTVNHNALRNMGYGKDTTFEPEFKKAIGINGDVSQSLRGRSKKMVGAVPNYNYLRSMTGVERNHFRY